MWILVLVLIQMSYGGSRAIEHIEFNSKAACEEAQAAVTKNLDAFGASNYFFTLCVPKDKE